MKTVIFTFLFFLMNTICSYGQESNFNIKIIRVSENSNSTTGELFVNNKFLCHTLEKPWQNNQSYISAIPSGSYKAFLRYDKNDKWRLQLEDVPNRTGIQIHIGNWPSEIEGCVLVGNKIINKDNKIESSVDAYQKLKETFYGSSSPNSTPDVEITVEIVYNNSYTNFEFENRSAKLLTYTNENGKWMMFGSEKNEVFRDKDYIYFQGYIIGNSKYFRVKLMGGDLERAENLNGQWVRVWKNLNRNN